MDSVLIVVEGIDGSGKTTLTKSLVEHFNSRPGKGFKSIYTKEPTDSSLGLFAKSYSRDPMAKALLFAADRIEHCNNELVSYDGKYDLVFCGRYTWSSYAYQLESVEAQPTDFGWIGFLNMKARVPNLILLLNIQPELAVERLQLRGEDTTDILPELYRVSENYQSLFDYYEGGVSPQCVMLDGSKSPLELLSSAVVYVDKFLGSFYHVNGNSKGNR